MNNKIYKITNYKFERRDNYHIVNLMIFNYYYFIISFCINFIIKHNKYKLYVLLIFKYEMLLKYDFGYVFLQIY